MISTYPSYQHFVSAVDEELLKLMEEQPDFQYSNGRNAPVSNTDPDKIILCRYDGPRSDGYGKLYGPECDGCIFGQALQRLGVEKQYMNKVINIHSMFYNQKYEPPFYWTDIQHSQDNGEKWGELKKYLP